jgi:hypothetical protein
MQLVPKTNAMWSRISSAHRSLKSREHFSGLTSWPVPLQKFSKMCFILTAYWVSALKKSKLWRETEWLR